MLCFAKNLLLGIQKDNIDLFSLFNWIKISSLLDLKSSMLTLNHPACT